MYKVIIADDEALFREYLDTLIDWKSYGFELCGKAKNGIEALELAVKTKPDIALVDINMPLMDGLTLSERLKKEYDNICTVLVTGYNEFKYARKAIRIGVEDYIVKPFDKNELVAALLKIKGKLEKERDEKEAEKDNFYLMRERALNMLLEGASSSSDEEIYKQLERLNINMNGYFFIVSAIEIDNLYQKWRNVNHIIECKYSVSNIINNMIKVKGSHYVFNGPENRIISIVGFNNISQTDAFNPEIFQQACDFIMEYYDFTVTIGVGTVVKGFKSLRDSYLKSLDAIRNKSLYGIGKVLAYMEIESGPKKLSFYPSEINEKLTMFMRLNDYYHIEEELDKIFNYYISNKLFLDNNYAIFMGLISVCLAHITEMGNNIEDVLGIDFSPLQIINNKMPVEIASGLIIELYKKTINYYSGNKFSKARKIAKMVKDYIDLNYKDNELSLKKISNSMFLNPDYLRRAFKEELNITLTDYILSVRMRRAKELIECENIKLSNLCFEVGISDASYFSKCFKKYYGLSPREYENMKKS